MTATIFIVEEHDILRWSLRTWLEFSFPGCQIVEIDNHANAQALAMIYLPEVMIVDVNLSDGGVFAAVAQLKMISPASKIIVLADYNDDAHRAHALASGASAFVYKRAILVQLQPTLIGILGLHNRFIGPNQEVMQESFNERDERFPKAENSSP